MKILFITVGLYTGGAEIMLFHLLSRINQERFKPIVISLMDSGTIGERIESLGIPVHTIGMHPGKVTPISVWKLLRTVSKIKPDVIQGWMYHGNIAANFFKIFSFQKIPIIWCIHHSINSLKSEKKLTQALIRFGTFISQTTEKIIFVSRKSKIQHQLLGYCPNKICVIPNGFDTLLYKPSNTARLKLREELGLPEDSFLIGLVCRYHPMKDHTNFLKAAALLSEKFASVKFVLAGRDVDYKNQILSQQINEFNLVDKVYLLGERHDTSQLIAALDIMSLASAYGEAFPLVIGEAMSCGVTCVVTDVGDSSWIVGDTGRVVPPQNPNALANAWQELIIMSSEERLALGKAARERVIESFSLDFVVEQYEKLYDQIRNNNSTYKVTN